jgi:hypothetical protein
MKPVLLRLCLSSLLLLAACGATNPVSDGVITGAASDVEFTATSIEASRTPASCGLTEPAFSSGDHFMLEVTGPTDTPPPIATLSVDLASDVDVGTSIPLAVASIIGDATTGGASVALSDDLKVRFALIVSPGSGQLDSSGVASVSVTVRALPTADEQPLSAEVAIQFVDGRELDQTYTATLRTAVMLCPAAG